MNTNCAIQIKAGKNQSNLKVNWRSLIHDGHLTLGKHYFSKFIGSLLEERPSLTGQMEMSHVSLHITEYCNSLSRILLVSFDSTLMQLDYSRYIYQNSTLESWVVSYDMEGKTLLVFLMNMPLQKSAISSNYQRQRCVCFP